MARIRDVIELLRCAKVLTIALSITEVMMITYVWRAVYYSRGCSLNRPLGLVLTRLCLRTAPI